MTTNTPHQNQPLASTGAPLEEADSAMILIHGRGATAEGILDLARVLPKEGMAYLAPQAVNNSWYPYRFIAPIKENEPYLSSALAVIDDLVINLNTSGITTPRIILGGFSQGACLASEYVARNPARFGGLLVFSGGLIGHELSTYEGKLEGTPILIGCSDIDPHIPLKRVDETTDILTTLGAVVSKKIYPGMGHTVNADEIREAQKILLVL